jgi:tRNA pseudouridine13 synthase
LSFQPYDLASLAYFTADVPGIGGVIKQRVEDFLVDEQSLYPPSGSGEHVMLFVERAGLTTTEVAHRLSTSFRVRRNDIGFAGMKDKQAVTRQHFTVRMTDEQLRDGLPRLEPARIKVLWLERHDSKLRRGHLAGNRFVIRIRQVDATAVIRVRQMLKVIAAGGVPNYIGEQRFGYRGDNHTLGRLLMKRDYQGMLDLMLGGPTELDYDASRASRVAYDKRDYAKAISLLPRSSRTERTALDALRQGKSARDAVMMIDGQQRDFLISAAQSAMFNAVLDHRIRQGMFSTLLPGDLALFDGKHSFFAVDEDAADKDNAPDGRMATMDVSPSGPMWGSEMTRPAGVPLEWELKALHDFGLSEEALTKIEGARLSGTRRPTRVKLENVEVAGGVDEHGSFVKLAFTLGRGSFATVVLREIMKSKAAAGAEDSEGE